MTLRFATYLLAVTALVAAVGCAPQRERELVLPAAREYQAGQDKFLLGDYDGAARSFTDYIVKHPGSAHIAEAHYWIGVCRLNQQRRLEAEQAFRKVLAERTGGSLPLLAWVGIADCYRLDHRFTDAAAIYGRVLDTRSDEVPRDLLLFNQGVCLLRSGDTIAGKSALRKCMLKHPLSQWGAAAREKLELAGSFCAQTGAYDERSNADDQALELKAKGFDARVESCSGRFCVRVGKVDTWQDALALAWRLREAGYSPICLP